MGRSASNIDCLLPNYHAAISDFLNCAPLEESSIILPIQIEKTIGVETKTNNAYEYLLYGKRYMELMLLTLSRIADDLAKEKTGKFILKEFRAHPEP